MVHIRDPGCCFYKICCMIIHCSTSNGFLVPENIAGCNLLNSEIFPDLCSRGVVNKLCVRSTSTSADFSPYSIEISSDHHFLHLGHPEKSQNYHDFPVFSCLSWSRRWHEAEKWKDWRVSEVKKHITRSVCKLQLNQILAPLSGRDGK